MDPPMIPCEGASCPTHSRWHELGLCTMCGETVNTDSDGNARDHERVDVLAMVARGDFG